MEIPKTVLIYSIWLNQSSSFRIRRPLASFWTTHFDLLTFVKAYIELFFISVAGPRVPRIPHHFQIRWPYNSIARTQRLDTSLVSCILNDVNTRSPAVCPVLGITTTQNSGLQTSWHLRKGQKRQSPRRGLSHKKWKTDTLMWDSRLLAGWSGPWATQHRDDSVRVHVDAISGITACKCQMMKSSGCGISEGKQASIRGQMIVLRMGTRPVMNGGQIRGQTAKSWDLVEIRVLPHRAGNRLSIFEGGADVRTFWGWGSESQFLFWGGTEFIQSLDFLTVGIHTRVLYPGINWISRF
jgi:hypothetical protein